MSLFSHMEEHGDLVTVRGPDGKPIVMPKSMTGAGARSAARNTAAGLPSLKEMTAFIRDAAIRRGHDPDVAIKVARSEGLGPGIWQSNVKDNKRGREPSFGPFQLLVGGEGGWPRGMGNEFIETTGLDPRNPSTWKQQVEFALDRVSETGWSPWYGARHAGVDKWTGINRGDGRPVTQMASARASHPGGAGSMPLTSNVDNSFGQLMSDFENDPLMQPLPDMDMASLDPGSSEEFIDEPTMGETIGDAFSGAGDAIEESMRGFQGQKMAEELSEGLAQKRGAARQRHAMSLKNLFA